MAAESGSGNSPCRFRADPLYESPTNAIHHRVHSGMSGTMMEREEVGAAVGDSPEDSPTGIRSDRIAGRLLAGPIPALLGLMGLIQLATWVPHYLTWPLWADHDVFATLARGWDAGLLPYRDLACNQFP